MKALQLIELSGPGALALRDVPDPTAGSHLVVEVRAAGVNFPDLLMTQGAYQTRVSVPFVPGSEVAGVVRHAPPGCGFGVGDRVVAVPGLGGYAEKVAVHPAAAFPSPDELDDAQAVSLTVNYQTAYFSLVARAGLRSGEWVVVLGSAGGVGSATVQVAKALGARVVAVVRRPEGVELVEELAADHVVPLGPGWSEQVTDLIGGGADVVVDPVGGEAFDDAVRVLAPGGRVVVVGFAAGQGIPTVKVNRLLLRNVSVVGAGWAEHLRHRPQALRETVDALAGLVRDGLRPPSPRLYDLADGAVALQDLADGRVLGKAALVP